MTSEHFDIVIPLFKIRWNTRPVLEGLIHHYSPRTIHIITPQQEAHLLSAKIKEWNLACISIHPEEAFFAQKCGLSKDSICAELDLGTSLYTPGWFYQQLLKLGAPEGIENLSEWYLVWDSDLLPAATWPHLQEDGETLSHKFALLQHNQYGNPEIVAKWATWIETVLGVKAQTDPIGTFVPHHMWFKQEHLASFQVRLGEYYQSDDNWLILMMRSANDFGTFSEYWAYVSWVAAQAPADIAFYPYPEYGETTERFFDDGTGLFSKTLRESLGITAPAAADDGFDPTYDQVDAFIRQQYAADALPSSLAFESSPRHLKKNEATMHIEERRSPWNPRMAQVPATVG